MTTVYSTKRSSISATDSHEQRARNINQKNTAYINDMLMPSLSRQGSLNAAKSVRSTNGSTDTESTEWSHVPARGRAQSTLVPGSKQQERSISDDRGNTVDLIAQLKAQILCSRHSRQSRQNSVIASMLDSYGTPASEIMATRTIQQPYVTPSQPRVDQHRPPLSRAASSEADRSGVQAGAPSSKVSSNLQRFVAEEAQRKKYAAQQLHPSRTRHDVYSKQWQLPTSTNDAQLLWKHMQAEVNNQWSKKFNHTHEQSADSMPPRTQSEHAHQRTHDGSGSQSPQRHTVPTGDPPRQQYQSMSIAQLKYELQQRGIPADGCVEKADLIKRLLRGSATPAVARIASKSVDHTSDLQRAVESQRIVEDVSVWAHQHTDIRAMLNNLNNAHFSHAEYLHRHHSVDDVKKQYKRVLLRLHPDKQVHATQSQQIRATEIIKYLNQAMATYKAEQQHR